MSNNASPATPLPEEPSARKVRFDAIAIMTFGVLAAVSVVTLVVIRLRGLFTPDGVVWRLPVEPTPVSADGLRLYSQNGPGPAVTLEGSATRIDVTVPDLNTVSAVCLAASLVIVALTAIAVIACTARIAWLFQSGRFFTVPTSRTLTTLTYTGVLGGLIAFAAWRLGANGVEGALEVQAGDTAAPEWWSWYLIVLFAAFSSGLVDMALRRGIRIQRETEGLI